jgi:hypothetical protein
MGLEQRSIAVGQVKPLASMFGGPDAALGECLGAGGRHGADSAKVLGG